ncbi:MAG: tetratricopeptide repeat protein, partial [Terriglobia bacterium]
KAARRYAEIAPGSAHALHMPSHIFTDLGFWQESIQSNIASARAAQQATTSGEYNASGHQLHAMTFLEYAYLESGQDDAARHVIQDLQKVPGTKGNQIADEQADFSVEYATETHNWKRAENLTFAPGLYPVEKEQIDLARAIGAARSGNVTAARADIKNLIREQAAMAKGKSSPSAMKSESMDQLMAESWLAWAEGSGDQALAKMEAAVKMEDDEAWKDGDAAVQIPPREMLADLLLELQQPQKALTQYEAVLKLSPNRFDSVYGAARAAQAAGDVATAHQYFTELTKICGPHADRPELQQAREYLAEK